MTRMNHIEVQEVLVRDDVTYLHEHMLHKTFVMTIFFWYAESPKTDQSLGSLDYYECENAKMISSSLKVVFGQSYSLVFQTEMSKFDVFFSMFFLLMVSYLTGRHAFTLPRFGLRRNSQSDTPNLRRWHGDTVQLLRATPPKQRETSHSPSPAALSAALRRVRNLSGFLWWWCQSRRQTQTWRFPCLWRRSCGSRSLWRLCACSGRGTAPWCSYRRPRKCSGLHGKRSEEEKNHVFRETFKKQKTQKLVPKLGRSLSWQNYRRNLGSTCSGEPSWSSPRTRPSCWGRVRWRWLQSSGGCKCCWTSGDFRAYDSVKDKSVWFSIVSCLVYFRFYFEGFLVCCQHLNFTSCLIHDVCHLFLFASPAPNCSHLCSPAPVSSAELPVILLLVGLKCSQVCSYFSFSFLLRFSIYLSFVLILLVVFVIICPHKQCCWNEFIIVINHWSLIISFTALNHK